MSRVWKNARLVIFSSPKLGVVIVHLATVPPIMQLLAVPEVEEVCVVTLLSSEEIKGEKRNHKNSRY